MAERQAETAPSVNGDPAAPLLPPEVDAPGDLVRAAELIVERKGRDLLLLDLRGLSNATDYFLLASGTSDLHARAIAEHVIDELKKEDVRPSHVEGLRAGRWVLIDYIDFVVHVFHPAAREFYQLERLWGDAKATPVDSV